MAATTRVLAHAHAATYILCNPALIRYSLCAPQHMHPQTACCMHNTACTYTPCCMHLRTTSGTYTLCCMHNTACTYTLCCMHLRTTSGTKHYSLLATSTLQMYYSESTTSTHPWPFIMLFFTHAAAQACSLHPMHLLVVFTVH
jgi:hypothetical protein